MNFSRRLSLDSGTRNKAASNSMEEYDALEDLDEQQTKRAYTSSMEELVEQDTKTLEEMMPLHSSSFINRYQSKLDLIKELNERRDNLEEKKAVAIRLGLRLSVLVLNSMFLAPEDIGFLDVKTLCYLLSKQGLGDVKGPVLRKLLAIHMVLMIKMERKKGPYVLYPEKARDEDFFWWFSQAIQILEQIVSSLTLSKAKDFCGDKLSALESAFEACEERVAKIELKVAELRLQLSMADSAGRGTEREKKERRRKLKFFMLRKVIGSGVINLWKPLFKQEPEPKKEHV